MTKGEQFHIIMQFLDNGEKDYLIHGMEMGFNPLRLAEFILSERNKKKRKEMKQW